MMSVNDAGEPGQLKPPHGHEGDDVFSQLVTKIELPSHSFREQEYKLVHDYPAEGDAVIPLNSCKQSAGKAIQ